MVKSGQKNTHNEERSCRLSIYHLSVMDGFRKLIKKFVKTGGSQEMSSSLDLLSHYDVERGISIQNKQ